MNTINTSAKTSLKILLIDVRDILLNGAIAMLNYQYPDVNILTASTANIALNQIILFKPDLVIVDIMLANKPGETPKINTGIQLLIDIMNNYPQTNILVYSEYIQSLVGIKAEINSYQQGFIAAKKNISDIEIIKRINWALQGLTHIKEIKEINKINKLSQLKPEWLRVLNLAFREALQDKAIAQDICVSERMVRNYWDGLQEFLGIDSQEIKSQSKNMRIVTLNRAREVGLID